MNVGRVVAEQPALVQLNERFVHAPQTVADMDGDPKTELARLAEVLLRDVDCRELRSARRERHGDETVVRGEMRLADAAYVGEIRPLVADREPFLVGVAVAEYGAQARRLEPLHRAVRMRRRIVVVRPIVERRNPRVERLQSAEQVGDIHVLGRVEVAHHAAHAGKILRERPVRSARTEERLPGVPVRIDKTRNGDHAARVDRLVSGRVDHGADRGDLVVLDQDVASAKIADLRVYAQDGRVGDECLGHVRTSWTLQCEWVALRS